MRSQAALAAAGSSSSWRCFTLPVVCEALARYRSILCPAVIKEVCCRIGVDNKQIQGVIRLAKKNGRFPHMRPSPALPLHAIMHAQASLGVMQSSHKGVLVCC